MKPIYLDYNATTPILPEVADAMKPYLYDIFGNPSSDHFYGRTAKKAIEGSRAMAAAIINAKPHEIIFTSGGTESNNIAIAGYAMANREKGKHIISTEVEHPAVLEVLEHLSHIGFTHSLLPVDRYGVISVTDLKNAITEETILITVMHSNNEVGSIQPVDEIGETAKNFGIAFHSDAAQSVGKIRVDVEKSRIDLLSIAGHKLYAPKGIGALYIRNGTVLNKIIHGANHERDLRPGTENLLEIAGLGKACEIMKRDLERNSAYLLELRNYIAERLSKNIRDLLIITDLENSLPNTLSIAFKGISANRLTALAEGIAVSTGSACHADIKEASHVLKAMGISADYIMGAIRISVGLMMKKSEADAACLILERAADHLMKDTQIAVSDNSEPAEIRLTAFSNHLGCSCKIDQDILAGIMKSFIVKPGEKILVSNDSSDDSAVFEIGNNKAIVGSVDFFTPIVDDPYSYGQIACSNALSDIYAMGAAPLFGLSILCYPVSKLPLHVLERVLKGAHDKAAEAGINIIGGHSVEDSELKYGMAVTGIIDSDRIIKNNTARDGDLLAITKPLGSGIICAGMKKRAVSTKTAEYAIRVMAELNNRLDMFSEFHVSACTDITGFGLLGHLTEMIGDSNLEAILDMERMPVIESAYELLGQGIVPGKTRNNLKNALPAMEWSERISEADRLVLADAQTSGGLLIAFPPSFRDRILEYSKKRGYFFRIIGKIAESKIKRIRIQ